ncbi:MAG: hypothetical protein GW907_06585 [Betaproteobacteria bacterium]|nr:hypothetical protein [Betaproteobacteria bacterium]NCP81756.1 hypothetical protein [Rhodoferax sp.]NCS61041.1 hypothetical protein [Rhodoferax sp.]
MNTSAANRCHQCGATSYKTIIKRDDQGVMSPSGEFKCTGCSLTFKTIDEWRAGTTDRGQSLNSDETVQPPSSSLA